MVCGLWLKHELHELKRIARIGGENTDFTDLNGFHGLWLQTRIAPIKTNFTDWGLWLKTGANIEYINLV